MAFLHQSGFRGIASDKEAANKPETSVSNSPGLPRTDCFPGCGTFNIKTLTEQSPLPFLWGEGVCWGTAYSGPPCRFGDLKMK